MISLSDHLGSHKTLSHNHHIFLQLTLVAKFLFKAIGLEICKTSMISIELDVDWKKLQITMPAKEKKKPSKSHIICYLLNGTDFLISFREKPINLSMLGKCKHFSNVFSNVVKIGGGNHSHRVSPLEEASLHLFVSSGEKPKQYLEHEESAEMMAAKIDRDVVSGQRDCLQDVLMFLKLGGAVDIVHSPCFPPNSKVQGCEIGRHLMVPKLI